VVVVVDAFRASTTIAVLVSKAARVVPVASIEEAASVEADFRIDERGSAKVAGFDFGNSPTEILGSGIPPDSTVVLSTTNGTRIVEAAAGAQAILTGAFVNAESLAEDLSDGTYDDAGVVVVGCGWEGRYASEDEVTAGANLHRLRSRGRTWTNGPGASSSVICHAPRMRSRATALRGRSNVSATSGIWTIAWPRTRCRSCPVSSAARSWDERSRIFGPGANAKSRNFVLTGR
jgi:phosphosulfolactate phosphohydrolase-like enzyme